MTPIFCTKRFSEWAPLWETSYGRTRPTTCSASRRSSTLRHNRGRRDGIRPRDATASSICVTRHLPRSTWAARRTHSTGNRLRLIRMLHLWLHLFVWSVYACDLRVVCWSLQFMYGLLTLTINVLSVYACDLRMVCLHFWFTFGLFTLENYVSLFTP